MKARPTARRLPAVIASGQNDLVRLKLLRVWVHSQWLGWRSGAHA